MKRILKVMGLTLVVVITGCVGVIFVLTSGLTNATDEFFSYVQQEQYEVAYASTAEDFQEVTTYEQFIDFLAYTGLDGYESATWNSRSVENNTGRLEGTVTTNGGAIPMLIDLVKEDGDWKIYGIETNPEGL